ncbi:uncharacterized protein LOC143788890 [Ranitomeya variabilis]|uniref:uncharacterized protein LOC143788890 n=1 Tax=Ranitomeya variabilis TaxID=490064 RepID=UPI00405791F1
MVLMKLWSLYVVAVFCTGALSFWEMDFRAKDKTWLGQIDQVFGASGVDPQPPTDQTVENQAREIERLLIKRTKIWWNRVFLERYISKKLIPRGLRVRVIPSFPVEDDEFITKWEEACGTCSLTFMQLLVDLNTKSISNLDKNIDEVEVNFKQICPVDKINEYESKIEKSLDTCVKKILALQASKFQRDTRDFSSKNVYRWRKANSHVPRIVGAPSESSLSNISDSSEWSTSSMVTRSGPRNKRTRDVDFHPYKRIQHRSPDRKKNNNQRRNK